MDSRAFARPFFAKNKVSAATVINMVTADINVAYPANLAPSLLYAPLSNGNASVKAKYQNSGGKHLRAKDAPDARGDAQGATAGRAALAIIRSVSRYSASNDEK